MDVNNNNEKIILMSHLVDNNNKLICDIEELIKHKIFKSKNDIQQFVQNDKNNFCLLKKLDNKLYLSIIPVNIHHNSHLSSSIFMLNSWLFANFNLIVLIESVKNYI
jgi:hypothetical protein